MERARLILPKFRPGDRLRAVGRYPHMQGMVVVRKEGPCPEACCPSHDCPMWRVLRYGVEEVYCETVLEVDR